MLKRETPYEQEPRLSPFKIHQRERPWLHAQRHPSLQLAIHFSGTKLCWMLQSSFQTVANWEDGFPLFFLQRQQRIAGSVLAVEAATLGRVVIKIDIALIGVFPVV